MNKLVLLALIPFYALSWVKDPGYSYESLWSVKGVLLESNGYLKKNLELVYSPDEKKYGMTFYNFPGDLTMMYGSFHIRSCGKQVLGVLNGPEMEMTYDNKMILTDMFTHCKSPMFIRVYNGLGNYAQYKVNHQDDVKFKELK